MTAIPATEPVQRIPFEVCPLCTSPKFSLHASADCSRHHLWVPSIPAEIRWMRCDVCEHVFTDGYFTPEQTTALFARSNPSQLPGGNVEAQRMISARIVERVADRVDMEWGPTDVPGWTTSRIPRWLDIGFGDGSLLCAAQEWGFAPVGVDVRSQAVDALRRMGIETHLSIDGTVPVGGRFSVVSMADVLEHVPFPKLALQAVHGRLQAGGVLFVSCPNTGCVVWRVMTERDLNPYWIEVEHYHNFSRKRLVALLDECGFRPVHYAVSERYRMGMELIALRV